MCAILNLYPVLVNLIYDFCMHKKDNIILSQNYAERYAERNVTHPSASLAFLPSLSTHSHLLSVWRQSLQLLVYSSCISF